MFGLLSQCIWQKTPLCCFARAGKPLMEDRIGEIIEIHSEIWHSKYCNLLLGNLNTRAKGATWEEWIGQQLCHAEQQKSFNTIMVICPHRIFSLYLHWNKKWASLGYLLAGIWIRMAHVFLGVLHTTDHRRPALASHLQGGAHDSSCASSCHLVIQANSSPFNSCRFPMNSVHPDTFQHAGW